MSSSFHPYCALTLTLLHPSRSCSLPSHLVSLSASPTTWTHLVEKVSTRRPSRLSQDATLVFWKQSATRAEGTLRTAPVSPSRGRRPEHGSTCWRRCGCVAHLAFHRSPASRFRGRRRPDGHTSSIRCSSDLPNELVEESKFAPLNDEDPSFGPPALLLVGFTKDETSKILEFLKELDGEFLKIIHCTEDLLRLSVWEAMHTQQPDLEAVKIAKSLPRMCILSGLSGEEMMMFIDAFPESGLEPAVFAALVPNSANKRLSEVVEEIMGDHEMLSAGRPV